MLVFSQMDPTNFFLGKFDPRGPPTFKMETEQPEPREEENSNTGCGGSEDLQKVPNLAASIL